VLEIGTESGGIAHYFATHPGLHCDVTAVNVCDSRKSCDGYRFQLVEGAQLPFVSASFDIVITIQIKQEHAFKNGLIRPLKYVGRICSVGVIR
jgi:hypothetical protein